MGLVLNFSRGVFVFYSIFKVFVTSADYLCAIYQPFKHEELKETFPCPWGTAAGLPPPLVRMPTRLFV